MYKYEVEHLRGCGFLLEGYVVCKLLDSMPIALFGVVFDYSHFWLEVSPQSFFLDQSTGSEILRFS